MTSVKHPKTVDKTVLKSLGLSGGIYGAVPCAVDVKDGKVVRIRPLHWDDKYDPATFNAWKMEKNGKTFEPILKAAPSPWSLAYKKRTYSPNRVMYPLKRVDWDPKGERNPQNRGKSKYVRVSWDEAAQLVADEVKRVCDTYGPLAILVQGDGHGECKFIHAPHGCSTLLLDKLGGFTQQVRNPDSWEGWYWGSRHIWGKGLVGMMNPADNIVNDISMNSDMVVVWGGDPETTPWGFRGQLASRLMYFWTDIGIKQVYICPEVNYACGIHADKWIPVLPNTDAALQLAIMYVWITEGLYDKEYVATHTVGMDKMKAYVLGEEDGEPKTPAWASPKCGVPPWTIKALARDWAKKTVTIGHYFGGGMARGPYASEPARLEIILLGMQGLGKPGVHQSQIAYLGMPRNILGAGRQYMDMFNNLVESPVRRPVAQAAPRHAAGVGQAADPQDVDRGGHPPSAGRLLGHGRSRGAHVRPVQEVHLSHPEGEGRHRVPHDVDRHPLPRHLLELRQRRVRRHAELVHRVHRRAASLARERLRLCRHHPADEHHARSQRHHAQPA